MITYTAPIWRRIAALVYDSFLLIAITFAYGALTTGLKVVISGKGDEPYQPMFHSVLFPVGWVFCLVLFYCWFWRKSGQTLGMKTWRLKVVQAQNPNASPTWKQCLLRAAIATPGVLLVGSAYLFRFFDKDGDCLQDRLSNTRVIFIPKQETAKTQGSSEK